MLVKSIEFSTYLEDVTDVENGNIDVFVELEDGSNHYIVVATPKNIEFLINKEEMNFLKPWYPFIIVNQLTEDVIEEAIKGYSEEDGFWLKLYSLAGDISIEVLNKLQVE